MKIRSLNNIQATSGAVIDVHLSSRELNIARELFEDDREAVLVAANHYDVLRADGESKTDERAVAFAALEGYAAIIGDQDRAKRIRDYARKKFGPKVDIESEYARMVNAMQGANGADEAADLCRKFLQQYDEVMK